MKFKKGYMKVCVNRGKKSWQPVSIVWDEGILGEYYGICKNTDYSYGNYVITHLKTGVRVSCQFKKLNTARKALKEYESVGDFDVGIDSSFANDGLFPVYVPLSNYQEISRQHRAIDNKYRGGE